MRCLIKEPVDKNKKASDCSGLLGRKDEIERLNSECEKLQAETDKLEDKIDELSDLAEECREKEAKLREKLSESENKLMKIKAEADAKKSLLEMAHSRFEKLNNEKTQISITFFE